MEVKKLFFIVVLVTLFAEMYFYPFQSDLKLSLGVIVFSFVILSREDSKEITLGICCGIGVFLVRSIEDILIFNYGIYQAIFHSFPSLIYYFILGILMKITSLRRYKNNMLYCFLFLVVLDSISNVFEALIRKNINIKIFQVILLAAIIRSLIVQLLIFAHAKQKLFILKEEHQERYSQLNLLLSNVQCEMFYLKKSMKDIEKVMSESYSLYQDYKDNPELNERTLDIAREVHDIKKDYHRVIMGLESLINHVENDEVMTLSTIFTIINDNTSRYINAKRLSVKLMFSFQKDFEVIPYYKLFAILNNLITNSIEACDKQCIIKIIEEESDENIYIKVIDNGNGIEQDIIPYIFNPSFTTKFNEDTGESSTGIGLFHVKNIIESLNGAISVESHLDKQTTFTLTIPKISLSR